MRGLRDGRLWGYTKSETLFEPGPPFVDHRLKPFSLRSMASVRPERLRSHQVRGKT